MEGRGMGRGTQGKQDGHYRDFQVFTRQGLSGRKAGYLKEVGLGQIRGCRKDRGFGWEKIRDGGEQLFWRPGGKSGTEVSVGVCPRGGKQEE